MKQQIRAELKQGIVRRWYLYILPFALGQESGGQHHLGTASLTFSAVCRSIFRISTSRLKCRYYFY